MIWLSAMPRGILAFLGTYWMLTGNEVAFRGWVVLVCFMAVMALESRSPK